MVHVRAVSEEAGRELARQLGAPYIETSAKEPPLNIDRAFHEVSTCTGQGTYTTNNESTALSKTH